MEIHFEINHECLLSCRHCSSSTAGSVEKRGYTIEDMNAFLALFPQEKHVFLTGGEPLLCHDLEPILSDLTGQPQTVSAGLFTAGIVSRRGQLCAVQAEQARHLAACGLKTCYFSIYSSSAREHDWMTGVPGSLDLTLESIRNLSKQGVDAKVNLVVNRRNQDKLCQIIALASSLGCTEVRMLKLIRHGCAEQCWDEIGLTEQEYRTCVMNILDLHPDIGITASSCTDLLPCRPFRDAQGCQAGSRLAYVTINGDVYPCASTKNRSHCKIGTITEIETMKAYFERHDLPNPAALCSAL